MVVNQQAVIAPRGRGRPQVRSDEETHALIVAAAARTFQSEGYAAACVADIAQAAGVSTKTLYRLIPTKEALFESVVADRIDRFVLEVDHEVCATCDAATVIESLLVAYGRFALEEHVAAINRLVLAEGARFPDLRAYFYEKAVQRTKSAMAGVLGRLRERGLIEVEDLNEAAEMLRGMMAMEPQRALMLGLAKAPSETEIRTRAQRCAHLFLRGCAKTPSDVPARRPAGKSRTSSSAA
jgi:AcrR family transcriptional regulator